MGFACIGKNGRDVAGSTRAHLVRNRHACRALKRLDDLEYAVALSCSEVEGFAGR